MNSQPERATCPGCQADAQLLGERDGYRLYLCPRCEHTFVGNMPTPAQLDAFYDRYFYNGHSAFERVPPFVLKLLGDVVDTFEPHRGSGRLLDVGFGAGSLLSVARQHGYQTFGIESSRTAFEEAQRRQLGEVLHGDFLKVPWEPGSFDVITLVEVIEHLPDAGPFLQQAARLLRPGGLLYMTTPHGRGVSGRVLGLTWSVVSPPEHVQLYSLRSMRERLARHGFSHARVFSQSILPHELLAWGRQRLGLRPAAKAVSRVDDSYQLNQSLVENPVGKVIKREVNHALRLARLGDSLRVYATR